MDDSIKRAAVFTVAVLPVLAAAFICACNRRGGENTCGFKGQDITIALSSLPNTLDWNSGHESSAQNYPVLQAMMVGLTRLGPDFRQVVPGLAESWDVSYTSDNPPKQVYTFHLRRDVVWSDGRTGLTAHDFVFGWRRAILGADAADIPEIDGSEEVRTAAAMPGAPAERSARVAAALSRFGVEAIDDYTLKVTLTAPRNYFLSRVAYVYTFFPAPSADLKGKTEGEIAGYFNEPGDGKPMVLGPYRVASWDRVAQKVELVSNRFYYARKPEGFVEKLLLVKAELSRLMYDQCVIDFLLMDDPSSLDPPPPDMKVSQLLSTYWLGFNTSKVNLPLRKAIVQSIDREALFRPLSGLIPGARVARALIPPGMPGALGDDDPRLDELLSFNRDGAIRDLARSGYKGEELTMLVKSSNTFIPEATIAEGIKRQLAAAGIKVRVTTSSNFTSDIKDAGGATIPHLFLKRVGADYAYPHSIMLVFAPDGNSYTEWKRIDGGAPIGRFMELLDEGAAATGEAAMAETYFRAQKILQTDQAVAMPLFYPNRYYRTRRWIEGLAIDPFNFLTLRSMRLRPDEMTGAGR